MLNRVAFEHTLHPYQARRLTVMPIEITTGYRRPDGQ